MDHASPARLGGASRSGMLDPGRHHVVCPEMPPRVVHELAVTWMVDRLDSHDLLHESGTMLTDMLDQLCFLVRGAGYEDGSRVGDGARHPLQEIMIFRRVSAADAVGLVMQMAGRVVRMDDEPVDVRGAEVEHTRLPVIDPNNGVIVHRHGTSSLPVFRLLA